MFRFFDAAHPPQTVPPGCVAAAGYIGGQALHVWTLDEWQRFKAIRVLPIWVADTGTRADAQATSAALAARKLGWRAHARHRRAVVVDMENSTDAAFVRAFGNQLHAEGFDCWPYGSQSTIYSDPKVDGYWVALYDDVATLAGLPNAVAHQYLANVAFGGTEIDLSVGDSAALKRFGIGERKLHAV